jgi:ABC-type Na+ efflux pump permease subunit
MERDTALDIRPIFHRELLVASRKTGLWGGRDFFTAILMVIVLATFVARYYWDRGQVSAHNLMARVAFQAFLWMLAAHWTEIFGVFIGRAAPCIAQEKDRRTLDFLLTSRLSNSEIVLGNLAACWTVLVAGFAAGFPIVLILHLFGGVDIGFMALAYVGLLTTSFFMIALGVWVSTGASDARTAASASVLWWIAWLLIPFVVSTLFPRLGIRLPGLLLTVNAWLLTSSPIGLIFKVAGGVGAGRQLVEAVAWMSGLQLAGGVFLILWAVARLRWAYRVNVGSESKSLLARLVRPGWRWRPKPAVGDDPILWREMYTSRTGLLGKAIGLIILLGIYGGLCYVTFFFGRPALLEVCKNGYLSGLTSAEQPEMNLAIRFFMSGAEFDAPADLARTDFNVFLRTTTATLLFLISLVASGVTAEPVVNERTRHTWDSLIATPLSARDILRSNMLAALWRLRLLLGTLLALWTIGLAVGSVHPAGYVVSLLLAASWTWLMLVCGTRTSIVAKDRAEMSAHFMILFFITSSALFVPYLLPASMNSVVFAAGSPPFVAWLSLVSYRDIRNASHYPVYPVLQWIRINTHESPLVVAATCLLSISIPAVWGYSLWRSALANFDRLIGRPCRPSPTAGDQPAPARDL